MPRKNLLRRQRGRIADPETYAAIDAAFAASDVCFGVQTSTIFAEMKPLLDASYARGLTAEEEARLITLKARFNALANEQKQFMEAHLAHRLGPDSGSETVDG